LFENDPEPKLYFTAEINSKEIGSSGFDEEYNSARLFLSQNSTPHSVL
jgi:hypothetical protein